MVDNIQIDDKAAQEALETYAVTPLPGTSSITPDSITLLDRLVGNGINDLLLQAETDETMTGEVLRRLANRLKGAGEALLELVGSVLGEHIVRAQQNSTPNIEGLSLVQPFDEQDRIDIDIVFSVARDSMRALGWGEVAITDFTELQYRVRVALGL